MLIIKCEHYMALLFAACVFCSKKMWDLDDTSGKWVTLTDLSSILHVIFKRVSMSPAQLCYRAQRHPDEQHIDISFRRCSLDKFFRLCHQLKKFLPCLCWAFSTPCPLMPALLPAWCNCKLDHWNNPVKSNFLDGFWCWRKCLPVQQLFPSSWPSRQQQMSQIVFSDALVWGGSSAKAKSLWTCQVRWTPEQSAELWESHKRRTH